LLPNADIGLLANVTQDGAELSGGPCCVAAPRLAFRKPAVDLAPVRPAAACRGHVLSEEFDHWFGVNDGTIVNRFLNDTSFGKRSGGRQSALHNGRDEPLLDGGRGQCRNGENSGVTAVNAGMARTLE
jgi:hypothetical protein